MKTKKIELTIRELVYLRCLVDCDINNLKKVLALNEDNTEEYIERIIEMIDNANKIAEKL